MLSLENFHQKIKRQLSNFGYFYEIQNGSWFSLNSLQRDSYKGHNIFNCYFTKPKYVIPSKDTIQTMIVAFFQEPSKPYTSISKYMPYGDLYEKIFDDKLKSNYRLFLYPYLIKLYVDRLQYGSSKNPKFNKRYGRLLFISIYFKIVCDNILNISFQKIRSNPHMLDNIFRNFDVNDKILRLTDDIFDELSVFIDEYIKENQIATYHTFYSQWADSVQIKKQIDKLIKIYLKELKLIKMELKQTHIVLG